MVENSLIQTFVKLDEMLQKEEVNELLKSISCHLKNSQADDDYNFDIDFNVNNYRNNRSRLSNKSSGSSNNSSSINLSNNDSLDSNNSNNTNNESMNEVSTDYTKAYNEAIESYEKKFNNNKSEDSGSNSNYGKISTMLKKKDLVAKYMGTTANIVYLDNNFIYVANVGDSFSVMYKSKKAIKLNTEHKTSIVSEEERIYAAGLTVVNNRVEGKLNLTRALGKKYNIIN